MKVLKRFYSLSALVLGAFAIAPSAHASDRHDEECRAGMGSPIVGVWNGTLNFTTLGKATVLVSINEGGTFTETDSVDLNGTVGTASPGYAAWKAVDCRHYKLTINKTIFKDGQFFNIVLPGTIVLSEDGNSWTISLKQKVFDSVGNPIAQLSGTVSGSAKRVSAESDE